MNEKEDREMMDTLEVLEEQNNNDNGGNWLQLLLKV